MANASILIIYLEELFFIKNTLQPRQLIDRFEEILYARCEEDVDKEVANEIFEWYEDPFPTEEPLRAQIEYMKINSFLTSLVCGLDDGCFSQDEDEN